MERMLAKMAKTLNEYDEASLMNLWNEYAAKVMEFEPTRQWEENTLALCFIQAVHWKNQLFNYHLANESAPQEENAPPQEASPFPFAPPSAGQQKASAPSPAPVQAKKAKVIAFSGKPSSPTTK